MTRTALIAAFGVVVLAASLAGCGDDAAEVDEVVLVTHDSFAIPDEILAAFETDTGVAVRVLRSGDAG